MELSNPLQGDMLRIQELLKSAIHNHQLLVLELKGDCENAELKRKLVDVQRYIMFLGVSQKRLLQDLRKKLNAESPVISETELNESKKDVTSIVFTDLPSSQELPNSQELLSSQELTNSQELLSSQELPISQDIPSSQELPRSQDILSLQELEKDERTDDKDGCDEISNCDDQESINRDEITETLTEDPVETAHKLLEILEDRVASDNEDTPHKRARFLECDEVLPVDSICGTPELGATPQSSPRSSPPASESKQTPVHSRLLTRSSRLLADSMEPQIPSPPLRRRPESPEPLESPGGDLDAALDPHGDLKERQICFLACLGLVTPEHAAEISALQCQRKMKPSAMNPFIMMSGLDPSQKRRRETYLQSHSPHKSHNSDDSSPERDSSPCPSESRRGQSETPLGSENGENDQLFTEHQLDTLAEQHPFLLGEITLDQQALVGERDQLRGLHHQLSHEKELLEERKEELDYAIQEQDRRKSKLLEGEQKIRHAIERVHNFVAFFKENPPSP